MTRSQRHLRARRGWDSTGDFDNLSPTDIALSALEVASDAAVAAVVAAITAVDPNVIVGATQETYTFSIVEQDPVDQFGITGTNLVVADVLAEGPATVTIRATDSKGLTFDEEFEIEVTAP